MSRSPRNGVTLLEALVVIGIVVVLIETGWKLSTTQVSWLNSATLLASAVGAIVFGRIADILGRKKIYGYEVLILAAGAIASAFSPNYREGDREAR